MPLHLLSNRTSATVFFLTFLHSIITIWSLYFLPVYFQGVLGSSSSRSGVQLLPTILALVPFAAIGGTLLSKFGRYRPIHHAGFALVTIGFGLFTLLDRHSNTGSWVGFQLIQAAGAGLGMLIWDPFHFVFLSLLFLIVNLLRPFTLCFLNSGFKIHTETFSLCSHSHRITRRSSTLDRSRHRLGHSNMVLPP